MTEKPKFNIDEIVSFYKENPKTEHNPVIQNMIDHVKFDNSEKTIALIGTGGTLSSAYSPRNETIIPGRYQAAGIVLNNLKNNFGIIDYTISAIDLFAKDSRDIKNDDLKFLIDFVLSIKNQKILIVTGTYMLPRIAKLLMAIIPSETQKFIGLTGAMLPLGFLGSDASANIVATTAILNDRYKSNSDQKIFLSFHGDVYNDIQDIETLDFHPSSFDNKVILYPKASTVDADEA
jgi:L-asparaginase/Glu-tRNA(Gln) amidotransferase subunit D